MPHSISQQEKIFCGLKQKMVIPSVYNFFGECGWCNNTNHRRGDCDKCFAFGKTIFFCMRITDYVITNMWCPCQSLSSAKSSPVDRSCSPLCQHKGICITKGYNDYSNCHNCQRLNDSCPNIR